MPLPGVEAVSRKVATLFKDGVGCDSLKLIAPVKGLVGLE